MDLGLLGTNILHGDLHAVKQLIQLGTDVNSASSDHKSALFYACERGHYDIVECLLEHGANVNCKGPRPLIAAVQNGDAKCVKLLLKHGANVHYITSKGNTVMSNALRSGRFSVVSTLIDHGVVPNTQLTVETFRVARDKDARFLQTMLKKGSLSINSKKVAYAAIEYALKNGCLELASDMLSLPCSNSDMFSSTAVYYSVKFHHHDLLSDLLKKELNVNAVRESCTPLFVACTQRDFVSVRMLLKHGADPNLSCPTAATLDAHVRKTPLILAVENVDITLIEELLNNKADVAITDSEGNTALHAAAKIAKRNLSAGRKIIEKLLENDPKVNGLNGEGESALYRYLTRTSIVNHDVVRLLLDSGAGPNLTAKSQYRKTPLSYAVISNDEVLSRMLIEYGAKLDLEDAMGHTALFYAVTNEQHGMVELMLKLGAEVQIAEKENESLLHSALNSAVSSDIDVSTVNLLLDYGADTNAMVSGITPLYTACQKGLTTVVQKMLKCGAKVNASTSSPLYAACIKNYSAIAKLLLCKGADPNVPEPVLMAAAANGDHELVMLLLSHGANVNYAGTSGNTALHSAVTSTDRSKNKPGPSNENLVIETLLEVGADVNLSNKHGKTPMHLVVEQNLPYLVESMLLHGGNPNKALRYACEKETVKIAETLLIAGADANLTENATIGESLYARYSPLCIAAMKDNCELAKLLINYGADVNSTAPGEDSALHISLRKLRQHGYPFQPPTETSKITAMSKMLLEHGADVNPLTPYGHSPLLLLMSCVKVYDNYVPFADTMRLQNTQDINELIRMTIRKGAELHNSVFPEGQTTLLKALCAWRYGDRVAVELFKAGAGFRLVAYRCAPLDAIGRLQPANSIRLCQAVVKAGYKPHDKELQEIQQFAHEEELIPVYAELLSWLMEDRQEAPSLMRQCRVAIRRQLFIASAHRTIIPAIDQLTTLPSKLQQYLKFEGPLTEVDLEVAKMN